MTDAEDNVLLLGALRRLDTVAFAKEMGVPDDMPLHEVVKTMHLARLLPVFKRMLTKQQRAVSRRWLAENCKPEELV